MTTTPPDTLSPDTTRPLVRWLRRGSLLVWLTTVAVFFFGQFGDQWASVGRALQRLAGN